jgi:hypothetical protein
MNSQITYLEENDIFGYPQIFRGIEIYPIKVKDIHYQNLFYKLFCYPKQYIADLQILKMSYLAYILIAIQQNINPDGSDMADNLIEFLKYVTKKDINITWKYDGETPTINNLILKVIIGNQEFLEYDFDNLREIILQQNGLSFEYIEEYNPELEKYLDFNNRGGSNMTFQDEIFTFCVLMKTNLKEIESYTLFQFKNLFEKLLTLKEFDLYKPLLVGGQITLKRGEIKHYLYRSVKSGRYDSIKIDKDAFKNTDVYKDASH